MVWGPFGGLRPVVPAAEQGVPLPVAMVWGPFGGLRRGDLEPGEKVEPRRNGVGTLRGIETPAQTADFADVHPRRNGVGTLRGIETVAISPRSDRA